MTQFIERIHVSELTDKPTLSDSGTCNLKLDTGELRYWVSRMGVEDGEPYRKTITVERLIDGGWHTMFRYDGEQTYA